MADEPQVPSAPPPDSDKAEAHTQDSVTPAGRTLQFRRRVQAALAKLAPYPVAD